MLNQKIFDEINNRLTEILKNSPVQDIERNIKAMLNAFFSRLDLVTREEFDVQAQVLLRTREKLSELETKLSALEEMTKK